MTKEEFVKKLTDSVKVGDVFDNPGGGTSTIENIDRNRIKYRRGKSHIYFYFEDMYDAYHQFPNGFSSTDLKKFRPNVYDSNARPAGHGCNCTFLMMMLKAMGIVKQIEGRKEKPQDLPFRIKIN